MYQKYLEPIVEEFTTGEYYREVYNAKQEYFDKAGVVYEDDVEFEQRMCIFMDWYIFERDLPGVDLPHQILFSKKQRQIFERRSEYLPRFLLNHPFPLPVKAVHLDAQGSGRFGFVFKQDLYGY